MKKILFLMFGLLLFSVAELSAQSACCKPTTECKPAACCPTTPDCCEASIAKIQKEGKTRIKRKKFWQKKRSSNATRKRDVKAIARNQQSKIE